MKTIILTHKELSNIENTVKAMNLSSCYKQYEEIKRLRTALLQERTGDDSLVFEHERDLRVYKKIVRPEGFTNQELIELQGYGIDGMPYHCLNSEGKVCHQKENGGISMALGAPEYSIGALLTTITVPVECTVVVE